MEIYLSHDLVFIDDSGSLVMLFLDRIDAHLPRYHLVGLCYLTEVAHLL